MQISKYFLPLLKENPSDASIISHKLMLRAGMIRQVAAGIYTFLPLGMKVLKKIESIVREEMDKSGALEVTMPCIQPVELWEQSGRFGTGDDLSNEMLKMHDRHNNLLVFSPTAEEVICRIFADNTQSYKSLPCNLYQIHWKFRDEIRPRFGLMRGREFLMKDSYSFDTDKECALRTYEKMMKTYFNIFKRIGLKAIPVTADSGSIGGDYSHEFHVLAETGESEIFFSPQLLDQLEEEFSLDVLRKFYAAAKDKHDPNSCPLNPQQLISKRGIEVGHVFYLGEKYSKSMNVKLQDVSGNLFYPHMGCYGIGISRLMAAIIEASHDENGIIWPEPVAPFAIGIIPLGEKYLEIALSLEQNLGKQGIDVLIDDTNDHAGNKFSKMDLLGLPLQIIIGSKALSSGIVDVKTRSNGHKQEIKLFEIEKFIVERTKR